jgi:hypothetical protein
MTTNNAIKPTIIHGLPLGRAEGSDGLGGNSELDVWNISCTVVPFGGGPGAIGFDPNWQPDFSGMPEQINVKLKPDPCAA